MRAAGWLMLVAPILEAQVIDLPRIAYVSGDRVRFSDLLPREVASDLREAAESVDMGQAPRFGSMRQYERGQLVEALKANPRIARRLAIPSEVVVRRTGYRLNPAKIHAAILQLLRENRFVGNLPDSALQWPGNIAAVEENPELQATGGNWDAVRGQFEFRLRCAGVEVCPDFLVYAPGLESLLTLPAARLGSAGKVPKKLDRLGLAAEKEPILVQAGRRAQLRIKENGVGISMPVVCLQRGRQGDWIRVRRIDSTHIFTAKVVGPDLLSIEVES